MSRRRTSRQRHPALYRQIARLRTCIDCDQPLAQGSMVWCAKHRASFPSTRSL